MNKSHSIIDLEAQEEAFDDKLSIFSMTTALKAPMQIC
jgi:hypothetical protein